VPRFLTPPKGWTLPRGWVWIIAGTSLGVVALMLAHAIGAGSMASLIYAMFGGGAVAIWLSIRRESPDTARGADALIIPVLLLLLRTADPAFDWLGSLGL
jgi:hypothetical protein